MNIAPNEAVRAALEDPARLQALRDADLLNTLPEDGFDRLARLAARLLNASLAQVNLLDDQWQYSKSSIAAPGWTGGRETPMEDSFCKYTIVTRQPFVVEDARIHPLVSRSAAVTDHGLVAYAGIPLLTPDGHAFGSLCVGDVQARAWTVAELEILQDLADAVATEVELRRETRRHMRARDEVAASRGELASLLAHMPGAAYRCANAPDWPMEVISEGVQRLTGIPAEEFTDGRASFGALIHPDDRERVWETVQDAVRQRRRFRAEYRIRTRAGEEAWVWEQGEGVFSPDGDLVGVCGFVTDVTERVRTQQAARDREATLRALVDASPDVVQLLDSEGRFRWLSRVVRETLGYSPEHLVGTLMQDVMHPDDRAPFIAAMEDLSSGRADELEIRYRARARTGKYVALEAHGRAVRSSHLEGTVLVVRDMTERARADAALREAKEEAERANRAKSEFLGRISHELRTPLNAILGFAQLLEMEVEGEGDRESVEQILRGGRHLLDLIDEVLDVTKIEGGHLDLSSETLELGEVLQQSLDLMRPIASAARIALHEHGGHPQVPFVTADRQRLKQVLLNLLSNAVKYNRPDGSVTVSWAAVGADRLRIQVADTGMGIDAAAAEQLFQPFVRLGARASGIEGTGLGLALSRGLARAMGGDVGFQSTPGVGSTFWVELPVAEAPAMRDESAQVGGEDTPASNDAIPAKTILFVEDNLANVRLLERVLSRRPRVKMLVAMQGRLGLEMARQHRPDLVLLDLNLPDMGGDEVLRHLREDPGLQEVPVVMISGDAMPGQISHLLALGATDYITKPFELTTLLGIIDRELCAAGAPE